jgi:hypothetical protein
MRSFDCPRCSQLLFFENSECLRCGAPVGFSPDAFEMADLETGRHHRCANAGLAACNWLVPARGGAVLCRSCELTRTRPADGDTEALAAFAEAEAAKRRLVFQLLDLGLPVARLGTGGSGVAFDLLSSEYTSVVTGHADGLITVDLAEADDVHRAQVQQNLGEAYRTVLGHFRHEIGHYYFPVLINRRLVGQARALFGDERADYAAAMDRHYDGGPPEDWEQRYVSAYATMHPSEDWAETFAHYLHIRDLVETADSFGVHLEPHTPEMLPVGVSADDLDLDPDEVDGMPFSEVVARWLPLTYALNAINRSMGHPDLYPFVLPPAVVDKLTFVHDVVRRRRSAGPAGPPKAVVTAPEPAGLG